MVDKNFKSVVQVDALVYTKLLKNKNKKKGLSVCWSGLRGPIAYSLLGGGVPIPEQRLCGTLDYVPLKFKVYYVL